MAQEVNWNDALGNQGPRIPKFHFMKEQKNYKKKIFFLPRLLKDDTHNKEGYGAFRCLRSVGKRCPACEAGWFVNPRFGLFIVEYATTPEGVLKSPFSYEVLAMIKSDKPSQYGRINDLHLQYGTEMFKHDFLVSCESTEYHMFNYNIELDCAWLKQPNKDAIKEDFKAKMAEYDLSKIIAPEISEQTMQLLIEGKIPNRYKTKNQKTAEQQGGQSQQGEQPAQGQTQATLAQAMEFPPKGSAPFVPPVVPAQPATTAPAPPVPANAGGATKSDMDILNELS
jgi:hypothetical protein